MECLRVDLVIKGLSLEGSSEERFELRVYREAFEFFNSSAFRYREDNKGSSVFLNMLRSGMIKPAQAVLRYNLAGSSPLRASPVSLSHRSSCSLIAQAAPLRFPCLRTDV